jgi:hypothetical protein
MIPEHVVRFGQALKPMLEMVADALAPQAAATVLRPAWLEADARLRGVVSAAQRFVTAAEDIPRSILPLRDCSDLHISKVVQPMQAAADDLVELLGVTAMVAIGPNAKRRDVTLHRITRDHLVSIAHWLADFVEVTARPELIMLNGNAEGDGKVSVQLELKMSTPDTLAELDTWMPAHLAYRADHVRSVLRLVPAKPAPVHRYEITVGQENHSPRPPAKGPSPLCGIGSGLILGWLLGDWFSDD